MLFISFGLAAAFAATTLGAAIRVNEEAGSNDLSGSSNKKNLSKREYSIFWDIWTSQNAPPSYPADTDDAWMKVDLKFPVKLFHTVSRTMYISMNGFVTLDKPSGPKLPGKNRPLPVYPTDCYQSAAGCMPKTIVAPLWQDLWIAPSFTTLFVSMYYRAPNGTTTAGASYSFLWKVCSKTGSKEASAPTNITMCQNTDNLVVAQLGFSESKPGIWEFSFIGTGADKVPATVGVQNLPNYSQRTYPPSVNSRSSLTFDTNKRMRG